MVIQVKTVITLGGKRAQIGRKHERAFTGTGKVLYFDLGDGNRMPIKWKNSLWIH